MDIRPSRIFPLGENALTVEFGDTLSEPLNDAAIGLANYFSDNPFPGFVEAVPAISSTTIFYSCHAVSDTSTGPSAFEAVKDRVERALDSVSPLPAANAQFIDVPVNFSDADSPDLDLVASTAGLDAEEVIEIFTSAVYRVFMLGFLPGFAYMGPVDERIAVPRRDAPRLDVPAGSVAIAGRQTGIYPAESPGGWQIIGRTPLPLLQPDGPSPCIFAAGDRVRFVRA